MILLGMDSFICDSMTMEIVGRLRAAFPGWKRGGFWEFLRELHPRFHFAKDSSPVQYDMLRSPFPLPPSFTRFTLLPARTMSPSLTQNNRSAYRSSTAGRGIKR